MFWAISEVGNTNQVDAFSIWQLHEDSNIIILALESDKTARKEKHKTHCHEHQILLTLCNAILSSGTCANSTLGRKSSPAG
jgi:hypothetical protein